MNCEKRISGKLAGWLRRVVWIFAIAVMMARAGAEDLAASFDAANKSYAEGKYSEAAGAYDKLLAGGNVSEAIYFNRGNAWYKAGQLGRAIASYRQAELLAPRDAALRANLQAARTRARGGSMYRGERWRKLIDWLSVNEWAAGVAAAVWVLFILLALGQWRTELRKALRDYVFMVAGAVVLLGIGLGLSFYTGYGSPTAIVIAGEAEVRNGPLEEAVTVFKVRDGAELEIADQKDGWLQVIDPAQRIGWVKQDQVILLDGGKVVKAGS